jgi:hypothetical protein
MFKECILQMGTLGGGFWDGNIGGSSFQKLWHISSYGLNEILKIGHLERHSWRE